MTTEQKLEALRLLATRNYATWSKAGLISNWDIIGKYELEGKYTKAQLVSITVEQEIDDQLSEPTFSKGWNNQIDYFLEQLIIEMDFTEKVELIVSGLIRDEWRAAL